MNLGRRLLHLAQRGVNDALDWVEDAASGRRDPARDELEDYLRAPDSPAATAFSSSPGRAAPPPPSSPPPPPPQVHPLAAEYRLVGAPIGSDLETVTRCWRERVRELHPDRFAHDAAAQSRASERFRTVNEAYQKLRAAHGK